MLNCTALAASHVLAAPTHEGTIVIRGAHVYHAGAYEQRDLYIIDGRFVEPFDGAPDVVIDAEDKWIIPPFAEGHCHTFFGGDRNITRSESLLQSGVFYAGSMNNPKWLPGQYAEQVEDSKVPMVDLLCANGGFTRTECHPVPLYRNLHVRVYKNDPETFMETNNDSVFHIVNEPEDFEPRWEAFSGNDAGIVKIYLLGSESYENGQDFRGLSPDVAELIVNRAHEEGLRVIAHIETAIDFRNAIEAGVDLLAHLPYGFNASRPDERYLITEDMAKLAADAGIGVISTTSVAYANANRPNEQNEERSARADRLCKANLQVLKDAGVNLLIGSDGWNPANEPDALRRLDVFTNQELLHQWAVSTPQALFPDRQIGELMPGYEASLLILDADPIEEWDAIEKLHRIIKGGIAIPIDAD